MHDAGRQQPKRGVIVMLKILLVACALTVMIVASQAQSRCTTTCDPPGRGWNSCRTICW